MCLTSALAFSCLKYEDHKLLVRVTEGYYSLGWSHVEGRKLEILSYAGLPWEMWCCWGTGWRGFELIRKVKESSQRPSWILSYVILQPRKKPVIKDSQVVQNLSLDAQFRHIRSDLWNSDFEMHSNTVQEQVEFRVLPETKRCKSACYGLQGLQVAWCCRCTSSVNSKDLLWYSSQALCNSFSVYTTPEPKEGGRRSLLSQHPPGHSVPMIDPTWLGTGLIVQQNNPTHWNKS